MKQAKIEVPIGQIKELFENNKLNMNPQYQRDYIAKDRVKWQQKLIKNILSTEMVIPNLYVRVSDLKPFNTPDNAKGFYNHLSEMIDGQQRSRTCVDFINDKFETPIDTRVDFDFGNNYNEILDIGGLTFTQIKNKYPKIAEKFLNKNLSCVACFSMDEEAIHKLFIDLNDLNNMTAQEKRNAIVSSAGDYIRNTARLQPHKLFLRDDSLNGKYINLKFQKMLQDEALAKIVAYREGSGKENGVVKKTLDDLYTNINYRHNFKLDKKITKILQQIFLMIEDKKYRKIINLGVLLNLMMIIEYCSHSKNGVKINHNYKFREWFFNTHRKLSKVSAEQKKQGIEETNYHQKTRLDASGSGLKLRLYYLLKELQNCGGVTMVDPKRVVSDTTAIDMWFKADKKCQGCDKDLKLDDVIKAHKEAWTHGGQTTEENTFVSCKDCNRPKIKSEVA
jgi:hypothetical protein